MAGPDDAKFQQFSAVLLTELLERTRKNMELLAPERPAAGPLPFVQTPSFVEVYAEIVRVGIFPVVLSRRPVRSIVGDVDWAKEGREYLLTVLDDRSNSVFTAWDFAWDALWDERKAQAATGASGGGDEKKGLLGKLFGRKPAKPEPAKTPESEEPAQLMDGLYKLLNGLAERRNFLPMFHDDVKILKGLVRVKPARLNSAWKELSQYHHQEFILTGNEQAKSGVLSECLQKWHFNLPEKIGEFLVVKAAVDLESVNKPFIGKYIRQSARTQEEAERGMPYLTLYWKSMPNAVYIEGS